MSTADKPTGAASAAASELAIIGALLNEPEAALAACDEAEINRESFTDSQNAAAYSAVAAMIAEGQTVEIGAVAAALGGGEETAAEQLRRCAAICKTAKNATAHAERIKQAERTRKFARALKSAQKRMESGDPIGGIVEAVKAEAEAVTGESSGPRIVSAPDFMAVTLAEPPQVIHGIIRAGQVGMMAAPSKGGKTWAVKALGMAVTVGGSWMGWKTTQGRALYINAELPPYDLQRRIEKLSAALGLEGVPPLLDLWHLRGRVPPLRGLIPAILRRQRRNGAPYALILPDPLYCFGDGRDENDNAEQAKTMAELSELAERSGAAVWATHHFSKGNKSQTEHLDRASGAGMFARAVDTFMTLTRHEEEGCYTVETTCRSFARPEPFVVRWEYPLWRIEAALDPEALKPHARPGRTPRFTVQSIVELLPRQGIRFTDWQKKAEGTLGIKTARFAQLVKAAKDNGAAVLDVFGMYTQAGGRP